MLKILKISLFVGGIAIGMSLSMQGLQTLANTPDLEEKMPLVAAALDSVGLSSLPEQAGEFVGASDIGEGQNSGAIDGLLAGMQGAVGAASTAVTEAFAPDKPTQINRPGGQSSTRTSGGAKFVSLD